MLLTPAGCTQADCYEATARPGDILFYPRKWFHQTLNLDPVTIGLAGRRIDATNYRHVYTHFKVSRNFDSCSLKLGLLNVCARTTQVHCSREQRMVPNAPPLTRETCQRIDSCMEQWRSLFEYNPNDTGGEDLAVSWEAISSALTLPSCAAKQQSEETLKLIEAPSHIFAGAYADL